jgi:outer membrane protein OmpA-like peptidoglycan-associated protein
MNTFNSRRFSRSARAGASGLLGLGLALLVGCATPPKPPELEAFEKLRADPAADQAAKRAPDLVKASDMLLDRARKDWQGNDLDDSRKAALLGQIKLKHAMALAEQDRARKRMVSTESELEKEGDELARLQKELAALNEQVALLRRLNDAATERQRLAEQLSAEQQNVATERLKAGATERIADAELAIKTAETVNAQEFAAPLYGAAVDNLKRAQGEFQQGQFQAAQTSAEMAKMKAAEAEKAARPRHEQEEQAAATRAQAEALARDATAIPGIVVRRESRGSLQRLVLPIPSENLFTRRETTVAPGKGAAYLDAIASLMKKYPTFPVQVVGYTDNRGRTGELLALSLARAQSVFSALVTRGVEAKRMVVSGQGGAEPVSDNRTVAGRNLNNRVEIIFLYQ